MSRFEFLMMIAAVVVAVGLTEIVGGWGRMMRTHATVRNDWLHLSWTILILCSLIQYWIGMWAYNAFPIEDMVEIFFLIIPSLFGVLAVYAITPDVPLDGELVVRDYYWAKRRVVFLPLAAYLLAALVSDIVILGIDQVGVLDAIPFFAGAAAVVSLTFTTKFWVHVLVLCGWAANVVIRFFV
jgi:hypothetical protein